MTMWPSKCSVGIFLLHSRSTRSRSFFRAVVVWNPPLFLSTQVLKNVTSLSLASLSCFPATSLVVAERRGDSGVVIDLNPLLLYSGYLRTIPCGSQRFILEDNIFANLYGCVGSSVNSCANPCSLGVWWGLDLQPWVS